MRVVGGAAGCSGGTFTVSGYDYLGTLMTQTITVAAGTSTGWSTKAFKHIASVTPNFTDANNYSVGTSDVFGFALRSMAWELTMVAWAGSTMTSNTGWVAADTATATATTGDVRGTIQTSASGGGSGIGATVSNGSLSSLALTGRRLFMAHRPRMIDNLATTPTNTVPLFGAAQA